MATKTQEGENSETSSKTEDAQKHKNSPYELHFSDNPGSVITQVQLKGENYDEWARAMKRSLRARRKWGFIDGTIAEPVEGSPDLEDWLTVQARLVSWILNTIEPTLQTTISYLETAKAIWEDIKERFSVVNGPRIHQLKSELAQCKQGKMSVMQYYGKLKALWDDLGVHEPTLACSCKGCTYNLVTKLEKRKEEERRHTLLVGLDAEILNRLILPQYVPTAAQLADILTKALGKPQFDSFLDKLGILNLHAPT